MQGQNDDDLYHYVIGLGSNLGDRRESIERAVAILQTEIGTVVRRAEVLETAPVGAADRPFLNTALLLSTTHAPGSLMRLLLAVEERLGRVRTVKWGNRSIDLDVLMARRGDAPPMIFEDEMVRVPHPFLLERDFALAPAAEIAGDWMHPVSGTSLRDALDELLFPGGST